MATTQDNTGKKYRKLPHKNIISTEFCNKVRERLNLTDKELPDSKIKQVCHLSNQLIGDWVINNADGFHIKDNGRIIVSRWLPKALRGDKEEKIEEIINNPKNDDYMKRILVARYQKSLENFKKFSDGKKV